MVSSNIANRMSEQVDISLFSAEQIKNWLFHNAHYKGLSEKLIDKGRAFALVTNPFVTDEMPLISAIFVDDEVAAFTYVFPDELEKPEKKTVYWNTTLYVNPKYEGRGFAYCVIAQICEIYGKDYFDLDAAEASVENLKYQGMTVEYLTQYVLQNKNIIRQGLKGELAYWKDKWDRLITSKEKALRENLVGSDYQIEYVTYVDDELYSFIRDCSHQDLFLRSQQSFNWLLQQPFLNESPLMDRVGRTNDFASSTIEFRLYGVKVLRNNQIVGFVILRRAKDEWAVKYVYYKQGDEKETFLAIAEHLLSIPKRKLFTADNKLRDFINQYGIFSQCFEYKKSFAFPAEFGYDRSSSIQVGEGDNMT